MSYHRLIFLSLYVTEGYIMHEAPKARDWRRLETLMISDDMNICIQIALKQQNLDLLRAVARNVSTPSSGSYGQYLTPSEIQRLTKPTSMHSKTVRSWLSENSLVFTTVSPSVIQVSTSISEASSLLLTEFHHVVHRETGQIIVRAGDFWLPEAVDEAIAAVYGLHGLPMRLHSHSASSAQVNVTPSVIRSTYHVPFATPESLKSESNRQGVAEFQGQSFQTEDLISFFKSYVPSASLSTALLHKFVGNADKGGSGDEAALDVEYIMGTAPGILTEFWYWENIDFCADLKNWTTAILAAERPPLVHSVSYGWQGELADIGCSASHTQDIDSDLTKLAARGITMIFSSGDSGSGYAPPETCEPALELADSSLIGKPVANITSASSEQCCYEMKEHAAVKAWTYSPPDRFSEGAPVPHAHCNETIGVEFQGEIRLFFNGTNKYPVDKDACCRFATAVIDGSVVGYTFKSVSETDTMCALWRHIASTKTHVANTTSAHIVPKKAGTCLGYSSFEGTRMQKRSISGGPGLFKPKPTKLYPSWPASSPWVTAVGATRFVDARGQSEMATDAFGSGGGFSSMFSRFQGQAAAIDSYLASAAQLPPKGSFAGDYGRATPDLAAIGEGYQVIKNGTLISIGGTSASAPVFAALVSLLNDARIRVGKPPMGYLNPWLYAHPEVFTDITIGSNAYNRFGFKVKYGFNCSKGWDPVTGLGTPIFDKMMHEALKETQADAILI